MKHYLIKLRLILGDIEKHSTHLVAASCEEVACITALKDECHYDEPDFSEFPNGTGCWDGGQYVYKICGVKPLTKNQAKLYKTLVGA